RPHQQVETRERAAGPAQPAPGLHLGHAFGHVDGPGGGGPPQQPRVQRAAGGPPPPARERDPRPPAPPGLPPPPAPPPPLPRGGGGSAGGRGAGGAGAGGAGPPPQGFSRGWLWSKTVTDAPSRARCQANSEPAGPPPTTATFIRSGFRARPAPPRARRWP